jgi:excisionase family DNA binding protein
MSPEPRFVSVIQAAEILGVSENTVRRMVHAGRLPSLRTSERGRIRIPLTALQTCPRPTNGTGLDHVGSIA